MTDAQLNDEGKYETKSPQSTVSNDPLDNEDPGSTVNYGRTIGNHHFKQVKTNDYIDHVSEPVNNTYI